MKIYIDQSGKIEYTSDPTVVAFSNGKDKAVYIAAREKRKILTLFRHVDKRNIFTFKTFATLIYLLIKDDLSAIDSIAIDTEYPGRNSVIKKYLLDLIRRDQTEFESDSIYFCLIGKKHKAHKTAIDTFRRNRKPDIVLTSKDVIKWIL